QYRARFLSPPVPRSRGLDDPDANARTMDALMTDLPIVCTLSADGVRARKQGLLAQVARRATCMTKIPDGYRLAFDGESDTLSLIVTMIDAERQCCRFLQ